MSTPQFGYATGTINISRIVIPDSGHANGTKQAVDGTVLPLGVSADFGRVRPDPDFSQAAVDQAAQAGENIAFWPRGSVGVMLYCNAAWNPGDLIMADASGYGVACTSGNYAVGRAQEAGTIGAFCPIYVDPMLMH